MQIDNDTPPGADKAVVTTDENNPLKGYVPEGWEKPRGPGAESRDEESWDGQEEFITYARKLFDADAAYDKDNRDAALEDLKFLAGKQWDDAVAQDRADKGRPCMTINVLPQFVGQVMGDRRLNKTSIKIIADRDGTQQEAEVRAGLIKAIEHNSRAERVYDAACEDQVSCGISNFRIDMEYAGNDVFDQDIFIRHIPNPLAVIWDMMSVDPTGKDARHCFVQDILPRPIYDERFPEHPAPAEMGDHTDAQQAGWFDKDVVRITEFWELVDKPATFALMKDGSVIDITHLDDEPEDDMDGDKLLERQRIMEQVFVDPRTGKPRVRKSYRTYARMHLMTGFALLSEAYELPLTRLPIIKVEGRVIRVGEDRVRFGLVRFSKDSQRLKNYWRSVAAERLAMAPKAQWTATEDAVAGREDEWRQAHLEGDPLLIHNKGTEAPKRVDPPDVPAALLQEAQMNQQDIKDTTGLQDASLGMRSNEISGRAIKARQSEGDVATVIYHDNMNQSILEGGDVVNQLLPIAFDTVRTTLIIGEDDKPKTVELNNPERPDEPDITNGKYKTSIVTGPSFTTQRQEAQDAMMTLIQTSPELMNYIGDLVAKNMDWPGAFEIAERLKKMMQKAGTLPPDPEEQQSPEAQQAQAQAQAAQQAQLEEAAAQMQHAQAMRELELAKTQAQAEDAQAKVEQTKAALATASADARRAEAQADEAEAKARIAEIDAQMQPPERIHKMHLAERTASAKGSNSTTRGAGSRPGGDRRKGKGKPKPKTQSEGNNDAS